MQRLPQSFKKLFWDTDFDKLDYENNWPYIVGRILEKGRMEDVKGLFKLYKPDRIKSGFEDYPNFSARTKNMWKYYFTKY